MTGIILAAHSCTMIDQNSDLKPVAEDIINGFFSIWELYEDYPAGKSFLQHFEPELRAMLQDKLVLPSLTEIRRELLKELDA
jgi:hypothetical protein